MSKRPIGYHIEHYWCRECAPDGVREFRQPIYEGSDYGVPFTCDDCGKELVPCDHQWGEWFDYWDGGQARICQAPYCEEVQYRG